MAEEVKKIGIVGLGPVGMVLAVKLKQAGLEVALCDNNKVKVGLLRSEGIKLTQCMDEQEKFKHIYGSINDLAAFKPDIIFFALKSYQCKALMPIAAKIKTNDMRVVCAQNGIDVENILADYFGADHTLRMVINYAGNLAADNIVKVTFFNPPNYIGSMDDSKMKTAEKLSAALSKVELTTAAVDSFEIVKKSWEKTILNAALSPLCAVGRLTMAEAMADPDTVELIEQTIEEAVEVAAAEKIFYHDNFIRTCLQYLKKGGNHFPSLAVDLINNRQTEIDFFNGKIVEYGRKHYIRTSLNLTFTNMVKAMTSNSVKNQLPIGTAQLKNSGLIQKGAVISKSNPVYHGGNCFLGIDLGSAYSKFSVVDENALVVFRTSLKTLNRDKLAIKHVIEAVKEEYPIKFSCVTGYGRKHFPGADIVKTEINCAAVGVSAYKEGSKNIIDIGGEDIKVIRCDKDNNVENFYMNDKCAAGTGSFITEICERAEINVHEMSKMASQSSYSKELNSFCTVFAKTEIMKWMFEGMNVYDVAKGIYISIVNRINKLRIDGDVPVLMIGGVIHHHQYIKTLLEEKLHKTIEIIESPQHVVSLGAAIIALRTYQSKTVERESINSP